MAPDAGVAGGVSSPLSEKCYSLVIVTKWDWSPPATPASPHQARTGPLICTAALLTFRGIYHFRFQGLKSVIRCVIPLISFVSL